MKLDAEAVLRYRELAIAWSNARSEPDRANQIFREHHELYKGLRDYAEGRAVISRLLSDENSAVRLLAATHSLAWEQRAIAVLEDLVSKGDALAIDAKWTLRSFRNGTLNLDW